MDRRPRLIADEAPDPWSARKMLAFDSLSPEQRAQMREGTEDEATVDAFTDALNEQDQRKAKELIAEMIGEPEPIKLRRRL